MISAAYDGEGGVVTHLRHLTQALAILGHQVFLVTNAESDTPWTWEKHGVKVFRVLFDPQSRDADGHLQIYAPGRRAPYETILRMLLTRWKELRPDVIHAHDHDSSLIGSMLATVLKVPLVVTAHRAPLAWKPHRYLESPKDLFVEYLRRLKVVKRLVIPSEASRQVLRQQGFGSELKVIPHGIDAHVLRHAKDSGTHLASIGLVKATQSQRVTILCPVREDHHKDPMTFLRAAGELKRRYLYGEGARKLVFILTAEPSQELLHAAAGESLTIREDLYLRHFSSSAMPSVYRRSDICVIPSIRESFGQTVLEAFAFHVPVIAANSAALPEVVEHQKTGLLFDFGSPDDLVEQVCRMIDDPPFRKGLADEAFERLITKYAARRMAEDYARLYRGLRPKKKGRAKRPPAPQATKT
jgi:glycosyltransferase involved in cell wall biosynthesis